MASTVQFLAVILLNMCIASYSIHFDPIYISEKEHDYLRFADVRGHCQSVLSSATGLPYDTNRPDRLRRQLSFEKGDWRQDAGKAPLVPFDAGNAPNKGALRSPEPLSLAAFVVTHVAGDEEHRAKVAVNVSGVLVLTVHQKSVVPDFGPQMFAASPEFNLSAGSIRLKIIFEGVYTERAKGSGEDDAERVLCMVGSAVLPKRSADSVDPWGWAKNSGGWSSFQPPVTADNNILLVLRYPEKLTLTTREVVGQMGSTSSLSDASYFDTVQLRSALISSGAYNFRPEELAAGVGDALPWSDADNGASNRARDVYKGSYPCPVLSRYGRHGQVITMLPGWHCNSTTGASCHGIGPFEMDREADADLSAGVRIILQDLQCQEQQGYNMAGAAGTAMVSMVVRALYPWEDRDTAMWRTGLSGKTLSAEGVWNASTGQACMMACRGAGRSTCDFRVCIFLPTTLSITRMDTMLGLIYGVDAAGRVAQPPLLSFRQRIGSPRLWGDYTHDGKPLVPYKYNYTKVQQAVELRNRSGSPFDWRKIIPQSLPLSYPRIDDASDEMRSLSTLADRLILIFSTVPGLFRHEWIERPFLFLEVISLQQIIDRYTYRPQRHSGKEASSEGHRLLNVSAELTISQHQWPQNSVMSLEGVYDPEDGRMHLIGCRDVRLPRENSSASRDLQLELEDGMDCSIEVKVEYPSTTMHKFLMSTAKVEIVSMRTAADPLHFDAVKVRARPYNYLQELPGGFFHGVANGALCIVLLSATVAAVVSQLRYLRPHEDVAPYISLVMLGVQALGYCMPLVTGGEAILARVTLRWSGEGATAPSSSSSVPYYMFDNGRLCEAIDRAVKLLSLCAFCLTLRLGQKVWRSRARMVARSPPLDLARVPSDSKVLVYVYGIHLALFMLILALNREAVTVEQQVALMQDLFLLPQVIGNAVWRVNCRPLEGSFYVGVTAVRLLPHVVGPARYSGEPELVDGASGGRFFAKAGDAVIPLAAVALALVVHAQQRWNYAIVGRIGIPEKRKLQHIF